MPPKVQKLRGRTAAEIARNVEDALRDGRIAAGEQLPPVRAAAAGLGVSPATVAAAYKALQARGVIVSRGRLGTKVSHRPVHRPAPRPPAPPGVCDLSNGNPDPDLLPSHAEALRSIDPSVRLYGAPKEDPDLVKLATRDFAESGVAVGEVCVVSGAFDGIEQALRGCLRPGDSVGVEDPGFGGVFDLATSRGLNLAPMRVDAEGVLPDELARICDQGAAAVILTPRSHNPTGAFISETRARELRRVLRRRPDVLLIEDDHAALISDAPFHAVHEAKRGRWAHVRTMSKALNPDLRLALMTGDDATMTRVMDRMIVRERWVSHILQRTAHALLSDAGVRRQLRQACREYGERRGALVAALNAASIPAECRSGFNVWLNVAEETPVVQGLLAEGWAVSAGERFRIQSGPAIRVTAATLRPEQAPAFAAALSRVLQCPRSTAVA
jgi:DNA-binding transcriptional MocR family regulator